MEGIREIEHPFQNPIILECIFKNLDMIDLQECREVCRTWRHETGKAMRALGAVIIDCDEPHRRGPSKFLELVKTDESTFFQAPFADTFMLKKGVADCPEFWKTCGAHIKKLRLQNTTFSSADTFRHAIFQCCPNLEKLKLVDVQVLGKQSPVPKHWGPPQFTLNRNLKSLSFWLVGKEFSVGWLEILSQFPCLENLLATEMEDHFENVFRALEVARQHDATCWELKEVVLKGGGVPPITLPPPFVRVFGEGGGLALRSLSIGGFACNAKECVATVQNLVVAHAQSLKKLAISQTSNDFQFSSQTDIFPLPGNLVLENVETLQLLGLKMKSTRFLQAFPNLKKLILEVEEISEDTQTPYVTLKDCTQLILYNRIDEIEDFKRLFGLLPNLKKLMIDALENEEFSMICANWSDLTHLELANTYDVSDMEVDDAGISGFDRKDARKINKRGRRGYWRPTTVRRANLSSLKHLKSFFWKVSSVQYRNVGYCSKACGILELPELKYLNVERECGTRHELPDFVAMFESLSEQFPWDERKELAFESDVM